jgi:anti-sigma B factor antagonist
MSIDEEFQQERGVMILRINGDFWGGEWALHEKVKSCIERDRNNVVVDLTHVKRMNSQGIGVLISCLTSLREAGGNMKIAGANRNIGGHLELLNLYTVVESFETPEEAVGSFS